MVKAIGIFIACVVVLAVVVLSFALSVRLEESCGTGAVLAAMCVMAVGAAWAASPDAAAMADRVRRALHRSDIGKEKAAIAMGKDASQFSKQLRTIERLPSLSDLARLGDEFAVALALEILSDVGGYVVITDERMARVVSAAEAIADAMTPQQKAVA